ncbi:MAG: hypothetical protein COA52_09585 [Hyphomicrobiales bacterium]|nr:MAG: hypothetical protein COA52_09585 [Hyphomicrobiales bacterium]
MDWFASIDLYCERVGPAFWSEPFNAISNVAFLIVAFGAWHLARQRGNMDFFEGVVIVLAGLVGIGSFLFHTLANGWSELADVIPIWSFVACYVLLAIYRSTGENTLKTLRIGFIIATVIGVVFWFTSGDVTSEQDTTPALLNGSMQYAPALLALVLFAIITQIKKRAIRHHITAAAAVFLASLVFRTVDIDVCSATGIGTHFMWHILNATMIWLLLHALVKHMPPGGGALRG